MFCSVSSENCLKRFYSQIIKKYKYACLLQCIQWRIILVFKTEVKSPTCLRSPFTHQERRKRVRRVRSAQRPHCIFMTQGRGHCGLAQPIGCERRSEGVPVCSEEKLCEREPQHCSEKTDRESGGGKGWQCDPLFEGGV